jgi:hypothetical protein
MTRTEIEAMSFQQKLNKLRKGIVIPPPDRYSTKSKGLNAEKVYEVAAEHHTRGSFRYGNPTEYMWAWRKGLLDEMCEHMEPAKRGPKSCAE